MRQPNDLSRSPTAFEQSSDADCRHRNEPVELARRRDRAGDRAARVEEARHSTKTAFSNCFIVGETKRYRPDSRSHGSASPSRRVVTGSGWRVGCECMTWRPMLFTRQVSRFRVNIGGQDRSARYRTAEARLPRLAAWRTAHCSMAMIPTLAEEDAGAPTVNARIWSASVHASSTG